MRVDIRSINKERTTPTRHRRKSLEAQVHAGLDTTPVDLKRASAAERQMDLDEAMVDASSAEIPPFYSPFSKESWEEFAAVLDLSTGEAELVHNRYGARSIEVIAGLVSGTFYAETSQGTMESLAENPAFQGPDKNYLAGKAMESFLNVLAGNASNAADIEMARLLGNHELYIANTQDGRKFRAITETEKGTSVRTVSFDDLNLEDVGMDQDGNIVCQQKDGRQPIDIALLGRPSRPGGSLPGGYESSSLMETLSSDNHTGHYSRD